MVRFLNSPWRDPNKIGQKRSGPRSPVRGFEVIIEGKDPYILNCYVTRSETETAIAAGLELSDESSKLKHSVELCARARLFELIKPYPTESLLPIAEGPHLDCLAVANRLHIRQPKIMPFFTTFWSNARVNKHDNFITSRNELLRFATSLLEAGTRHGRCPQEIPPAHSTRSEDRAVLTHRRYRHG